MIFDSFEPGNPKLRLTRLKSGEIQAEILRPESPAELRRRLEQDPELTFEEADIRRVPNVGPMDLLVAFLRGPDGERIELLQDRNNAVL